MVITVNIVGQANIELSDTNIVNITLQVQIMDGIEVIGDKIISISVPKNTENLYSYCVNKMVDEIIDFKQNRTRNRNLNTSFSNFTNTVISRVT